MQKESQRYGQVGQEDLCRIRSARLEELRRIAVIPIDEKYEGTPETLDKWRRFVLPALARKQREAQSDGLIIIGWTFGTDYLAQKPVGSLLPPNKTLLENPNQFNTEDRYEFLIVSTIDGPDNQQKQWNLEAAKMEVRNVPVPVGEVLSLRRVVEFFNPEHIPNDISLERLRKAARASANATEAFDTLLQSGLILRTDFEDYWLLFYKIWGIMEAISGQLFRHGPRLLHSDITEYIGKK